MDIHTPRVQGTEFHDVFLELDRPGLVLLAKLETLEQAHFVKNLVERYVGLTNETPALRD